MIVWIFRVVKFAFQNFWRNIWLSAATVSVLVLTLLSINALLTLNVMSKVAMSTVQSKVDVSVYFKPETEENRVQTVKIFLLSLPEVKDVEYVSASRALERFSDAHKNDATVLATLGEIEGNPLGASLVVKAHRLEDYPKIMSSLDDPAYAKLIEEKNFDDRRIVIERIRAIAGKVEMTVVAVSALFAVITLLIVFNTIRMSIYNHRDEIAIMRLVGAGDGFIRAPFYVEAILWSALALGLTFAALIPALQFAQPYLRAFFGTGSVDIVGFYAANFGRVVGLQLAGLAALSVLTTKVAIAKYLKV